MQAQPNLILILLLLTCASLTVAAERVDTTICNGEPLMRDGRLSTLDMDAIVDATRQRTPDTWRRFGEL